MKKKIFKFIKKQWLLVWTLIVSAAMFAMIASAEYPGTNNYMKRVVVSDDSTDMMFSSNLLTFIENDKIAYQPYYVRQLTDDDLATTYDVDVYVWNYDINGTGDYYKKNISYQLNIKVVDKNGDTVTSLGSGKTIQIVKNDSTVLKSFNSSSSSYDYTHSPNETLATGARSQNKYTIKFSKNWDLENDSNTRVQITATPTSEFTDLKTLAAAIGLKEERAADVAGWKYYINEQRLNSAAAPSAYDAYNLVLTGTGSSTIVIEWDPTKVAINKDLYEQGGAYSFYSGEVTYYASGAAGGSSIPGWEKLVIEADSYSQLKEYRNRYDLQLYKFNGELSSAWDFVGASQSGNVCIVINGAEDALTESND